MSGGQGRIRRLAFAGALVALAVVVCYVEQIPWLELQSLVVFAAGYLLGWRWGAVVGALAMGFYSAVNPYGFAHPLVFASQLAGRAAVGAAGGWAAALRVPRGLAAKSAVLVAWGVAVSLLYDLLTNLATGVVMGQVGPVLVMGAPFALGHLASNAVLFVLVGGPLLSALEPRRALLGALAVGCMAWALAVPAAHALAAGRGDTGAARRAAGAAIDSVEPADSTAARADTAAARADTSGAGGATAAPGADTTQGAPEGLPAAAVRADSLRRAAAAAAKARADSLARVALESAVRAHRDSERGYGSGRWAAALGPATLARRSVLDPDDALDFLGAAPRFYEETCGLEPVTWAGLPPGLVAGEGEAGPLLPRLTLWDDPGLVSDGSRLAWGWSALPPVGVPGTPDSVRGPAPPGAADAPLAGRGRWQSEDARPPGKPNLSSVWLSLGHPQTSGQGFALRGRRALLGLDAGAAWSAWTRHHAELGELGPGSSHGLSVGADVRGTRWSLAVDHAAEAQALSDFFGFEGESRRSLRTSLRGSWAGDDGVFAGFSATRVEDRGSSSGPLIDPFARAARDLSASAWLGERLGEWRAGVRGAWVGERLRDTLGTAAYAPPDLGLWWGGGFLEGAALGGALWAGLDVESAAGRERLLPRLAWERASAGRWRFFADVGGVSGTALGEAERVLGAGDLPAVERPRATVAQAGLRFDSRPERDEAPAPGTPRVEPASLLAAPPGSFAPGRLRLGLSLVGWSATQVVFPAFGLFARDIVLGPALTGDVQGAAVVGDLDWAPTRWARLGASGYGAGRSLPGGIDVASPEYRVIAWGGPRLTLFTGSLELWLAGEADFVGSRQASDGVLPAMVRPGARLALGLGDAWLVGRVTDLDDVRHPLPGRRFDGERLLSPGRVFRLYGEWRFLD